MVVKQLCRVGTTFNSSSSPIAVCPGKVVSLYWYTVIPRYSSASELVRPCTQCILMRKNTFQPSALAQDSLHVLELTWVSAPPRKRKCFISQYSLVSHSSRVLELINKKYQGATVYIYRTSGKSWNFLKANWSLPLRSLKISNNLDPIGHRVC